MKASKIVVLAVFLAFLLGTVPSSIAWDGRVLPKDVTPNVDDPEPITEGDPWDDNEDGGPDNAVIGSNVIIINQLGMSWGFMKYHFSTYKVRLVKVDDTVRKVDRKKTTTSK